MFKVQPPPSIATKISDYYYSVYQMYLNLIWMLPSVSSDNGDSSVTITPGFGIPLTQIWNTPLTTNRTITLSTSGVPNGAKLRIVRTAGATGANTLTVVGKALAVGQWCDVEYNGTTWIETAFGNL